MLNISIQDLIWQKTFSMLKDEEKIDGRIRHAVHCYQSIKSKSYKLITSDAIYTVLLLLGACLPPSIYNLKNSLQSLGI